MKKTWKKGLALFLATCLAVAPMQINVQAQTSCKPITEGGKQLKKPAKSTAAYAEGEAIILYNSDVAKPASRAVSSVGPDVKIVESYDFKAPTGTKISAVKKGENITVSLVKSSTLSTQELVEKLNKQPSIKLAEPNFKIKAASVGDLSKYQWALSNTGQNNGTAGFDVNADALPHENLDTEEKVIALVDTGIDYTHPDLQSAVWNNPFESSTFKGAHGYDFINYDDDPLDDNGHGSHCSGIMAACASDNSGISGIATDKNIKIMALKILDADGYGYGMEAVGAYNYIYKAQQLGVNVVAVNNSWGGGEDDSMILETLINLVGENGALSVCAAGNSALNNDFSGDIPASLDSPYIISVAASNENDELAAFSNYGEASVDLAAPGTDILSTVSYPCFNPGIYDNKDEMCAYYEDFTDATLVKVISENSYTEEADRELAPNEFPYGMITNGGGTVSVNSTDEMNFGASDEVSASLKFEIKDAQAEEFYNLIIPYTVEQDTDSHSISVTFTANGPSGMDNPDAFFISATYICDAPLSDDGTYNEMQETIISAAAIEENTNYWNHGSYTVGQAKAGEKRAISIFVQTMDAGDYTVYIDNIGISKGNLSTEDFGKYDYYNGTSMATPYVTGAVAALRNVYPDEPMATFTNRISGSVRKSFDLTGFVKSSGTLDLSNAENPCMLIDDVYMDEDATINITGAFLSDAEVSVNCETVTPISHEDNLIVIDGTDHVNKTTTINVTKDESTQSFYRFFSMGEYFDFNLPAPGYLKEATMLSDGNNLIMAGTDGSIMKAVPITKDGYKTFELHEEIAGFTPDLFGDEYIYCANASMFPITEFVYGDEKVWTIAKIDVGYSSAIALLAYDPVLGWTNVAPIETDLVDLNNMAGCGLGYYNNSIYLFGGYDIETNELLTDVYRFNTTTCEWEDAPSLPSGRIYSKALQVGDKLIVTLGGDDDIYTSTNLIFDGTKWSTSKETIDMTQNNIFIPFDEDYETGIVVSDAQIGLVEDGIIYTNSGADGLGDTFIYNVSTDSFEPSGYQLSIDSFMYDHLYANTIENELYVLCGFEDYEDFDEWEDWKASKKLSDYDYDYDVDSWDGYFDVLSIPVKSGYVQLLDASSEGASVSVDGYHIPGNTVNFTCEVSDNYFLKDVTASEGTVKKGEDDYSITIPTSPKSNKISITANTGAYVTGATLPETINLAPGASTTINAQVVPANADNKTLLFTCTSDIVSVDANGTVTALANAATGKTATITVTSADRNLPLGSCTVVISEKEATKEAETVKVGSTVESKKCTYKVLTNTDKSKTVAFVSLNNKKATSISVPSSVKIKGKTYKVTKIEKEAFKNCKKLKKITIGKNVTSIGKNAFKNCSKLNKITVNSTKITKVYTNKINKKVTIKVPKSVKKKYAKLFKKAGYKGTVK